MLNLNDTQQGVLDIAFKLADDQGLLLLDLKDLRAVLQHLSENAREMQVEYGNVSAASIGAIQRGLLSLEQQGAEAFFGEPALNVADLVQTRDGRGVVNILAADRLLAAPKLYATMLLWLLSELYENLPEVGDLDKPKLVFFFDEAHLLFSDAPKILLEKIEQVVRLIRSKGVGIYFITQNPIDIPETILGQLGNRVQHALRAFSPRDQKAVKAAAQTMRANQALDVEAVITELAVGEALVSLLDDGGRPSVVERAWVLPPLSRVGPATDDERRGLIQRSILFAHYQNAIDRESAYERLKQARTAAPAEAPPPATHPSAKSEEPLGGILGSVLGGASTSGRGRAREGVFEALAKSAARAVGSEVGSEVGRRVLRGVLGSLLGGRRR